MPHEPIYDGVTGQRYEAYLAELKSIGGLSGSPVFVMLPPGRVHPMTRRVDDELRWYLLGLVRGHWDSKEPEELSEFAEEREIVNMGIAAVTPISAVLELLDLPSEVERRASVDKNVAARDQPVDDSGFDDAQVAAS